MSIKLNHTIVHARDKAASAHFLIELFGLPAAKPFGPFLGVELANEVTLDYLETDEPILVEHYAILVREAEINHHDGGRGLYFEDPSGHLLEIITRPYGSG